MEVAAMRTMTIEVPEAVAAELEARVAAELAQDVSDAVIDAVERTRDLGLEHWLRTEAVTRLERLRQGEPTLTLDEARERLDERRQARLAGR